MNKIIFNQLKYAALLNRSYKIGLLFLLAFIFCSGANAQADDYSHVNTDSLVSRLQTLNIGSYYWKIVNPNDWQDLSTFLPKAKIAGVDVYVSLLPPSQSPPVSPSAGYSEPYRLDYITWAKEIAALSLRYSNLYGFDIIDLRENIDLGYLQQSYINNVISQSASINPKLKFINNLPNSFYVDKYALGNGNGASWANAAVSLSALNWANITAGDIVYVSGGTDSVVYDQDVIKNVSADGGIITVTAGKDPGHNGKVIFSASAVNGYSASLAVDRCRNVKISGVSVRWMIDNLNRYCFNLLVQNSSDCFVDNCSLVTDGHCAPLFLKGDTSISVTNNKIETLLNSVNEKVQNDQDGIDVEFGAGGHSIIGNTISIRGLNGTVWHIDCMQWYNEGSPENLQTVIAGNFFYDVEPEAIFNGDAIYVAGCYSNRFLIYNNVVCGNTTAWDGFDFTGSPGYNMSVRLFNNTILNGSVKGTCLYFSEIDTVVIENNVIINDLSAIKEILMMNPAAVNYIASDYNYWFSRNRAWNNWTESTDIVWPIWQHSGYDLHSQNGRITLAKPYDPNSIESYKVINQSIPGKDLSSYFNTDILGNTRQPGAWSAGAIQSQ